MRSFPPSPNLRRASSSAARSTYAPVRARTVSALRRSRPVSSSPFSARTTAGIKSSLTAPPAMSSATISERRRTPIRRSAHRSSIWRWRISAQAIAAAAPLRAGSTAPALPGIFTVSSATPCPTARPASITTTAPTLPRRICKRAISSFSPTPPMPSGMSLSISATVRSFTHATASAE